RSAVAQCTEGKALEIREIDRSRRLLGGGVAFPEFLDESEEDFDVRTDRAEAFDPLGRVEPEDRRERPLLADDVFADTLEQPLDYLLAGRPRRDGRGLVELQLTYELRDGVDAGFVQEVAH